MHSIIHFYWLNFSDFYYMSKRIQMAKCGFGKKTEDELEWATCNANDPWKSRGNVKYLLTIISNEIFPVIRSSLFHAREKPSGPFVFSPSWVRIENPTYTFPRKKKSIIQMCICVHRFLSFSCSLHIFLSSMNKYTIIKPRAELRSEIKHSSFVFYLWELQRHWKWLVKTFLIWSLLLQYFQSFMSDSRWFLFFLFAHLQEVSRVWKVNV